MTEKSPGPWAEGDHLPWNDPRFSERMLKEHLSQDHDAASRRFETIDRHVQWIHKILLGGQPSRILDLGCGPGLYLQRLAMLGHDCTGIDFSPASIAYAKAAAKRAGFSIQYLQSDVRQADFGTGRDLVMMIWGEFNASPPIDASLILRKSLASLRPGGRILLEVSAFDALQKRGHQPKSESWHKSGLFLDTPHLCIEESSWDSHRSVCTNRWTITNKATGETTIHAASYQAYTAAQYEILIKDCGFATLEQYASVSGEADMQSKELLIFVGKK